MKILIATFTFHPEGNGVAEAATVQAFGLARRGHDVTVVCSPNEKRNPADYPPSLKIVEFDVTGSAELGIGFSGQVKEYQDFIASFVCDVMIFHCWDTWSLAVALPVLDRNPAKKILVSHGYAIHLWNPQPRFPWGWGVWVRWQPYVWGYRRHVKKLDHVVFLSNRKDWRRFFDRTLVDILGYRRWSVIPNGASIRRAPATLPDFRVQFGISRGEFLLLNVANYCDHKNQLATLRSFADARLENSLLVFIGSEINEYARELKKTLAEMKSSQNGLRVLILDHVSKELIFAAYRTADLFVLSAKTEAQPLVLLDAMASRLPFISTNTGCIAEFPGGVVIDSEKEMTEAMQKLAGNPAFRQELGRQGAEAVESNYDWDKNLDRYEHLLQKLVCEQPS